MRQTATSEERKNESRHLDRITLKVSGLENCLLDSGVETTMIEFEALLLLQPKSYILQDKQTLLSVQETSFQSMGTVDVSRYKWCPISLDVAESLVYEVVLGIAAGADVRCHRLDLACGLVVIPKLAFNSKEKEQLLQQRTGLIFLDWIHRYYKISTLWSNSTCEGGRQEFLSVVDLHVQADQNHSTKIHVILEASDPFDVVLGTAFLQQEQSVMAETKEGLKTF